MADLSAIKLPNGTTYNLKDKGALPLTGGAVTGPVSFGDSVSIDDATIGSLVVNGSASFTNNLQANTINGVTVGSNPKFTDTNTTYTAGTGLTLSGTQFSISKVPVANGGTGETTLNAASNALLNSLTTGSSTPSDNDYYISQYAGGGTTTTTYHRRPVSALWAYIKNKTDSTYLKLSGGNVSGPTHGFFSAAQYGGTGNTTKIKIKINSTTSWMLSFVVTLYQGYRATKIMISGYNYGNNYWYEPEAVLIADSDGVETLKTYFGYDSAYNLWVGFDGGSYTGVAITDVVNGYTQITDYSNLFTISNLTAFSGTVQTEKVAESKSNYAKTAGAVTWGNVSGKPTATGSKATGISIGNHATGTVIGVQSSTTTASKATAGTAKSIPNVTSVGSASNWVFENITVPVAASATACDDITSWSAGSGSASLTMAVDSSDSKKLNITFSHTHTAPTLNYTARSIAGVSGSVTASHVKSGGNGTAPTLGTAISITPYTFSDVTVPIKNTSASTFVTGTTHTVTDNGHTHSIS